MKLIQRMSQPLPLLPLLLLLLAVGCRATHDKDHIIYQVPEEVQPHLNSFMEEYESRGGDPMSLPLNLIIRWSDSMPDPDVVGYCQLNTLDMYLPEIVLLHSYWLSSDPVVREILVYHELGHCLLNYDHVETDITDIMFPNLINSVYYRENRDEILDNFFTGSDSRPRWPLRMPRSYGGETGPEYRCHPEVPADSMLRLPESLDGGRGSTGGGECRQMHQ
jgi:hypothetical protein